MKIYKKWVPIFFLVLLILIASGTMILGYSKSIYVKHQDSAKSNNFNKTAINLNNSAMKLWQTEVLKDKPDIRTLNRVLTILDSSIAIDSSYYISFGNKASIYCQIGKIPEAIITIENYIGRNPNMAESYDFLGRLYTSAGKNKKARLLFEKALMLYENQFKSKHWFNSLGNQIIMLTILGNKAKADSLICQMPREFPDKKREIADYLEYYLQFKREDIGVCGKKKNY